MKILKIFCKIFGSGIRLFIPLLESPIDFYNCGVEIRELWHEIASSLAQYERTREVKQETLLQNYYDFRMLFQCFYEARRWFVIET